MVATLSRGERSADPWWQTVFVKDEELLAKAEEALTEIKVDQGLPDRLGEAIAKTEGKGKPSLDDLLGREPKKKPDWPS